jgi:hypothetical protein
VISEDSERSKIPSSVSFLVFVVHVAYSLRGKIVRLKSSEKSMEVTAEICELSTLSWTVSFHESVPSGL